jgi:ammonia channel protein AmtB
MPLSLVYMGECSYSHVSMILLFSLVSLPGMVSGAIAGLVSVTPASGYINVTGKKLYH